MSKKDYVVGYGKPPKQSQFVPGQSGFKGRRKHPPESHSSIVARVRDELVTVNGRTMTKFELALQSTFNQTIKGGKARELKALYDLLEKHGAIPSFDQAAADQAAGEAVVAKIFDYFHKTHDIDPADSAAVDQLNAEEARLVMSCKCCGPELRKRWKDPEYLARLRRYGGSTIHGMVIGPSSRMAMTLKTSKSDLETLDQQIEDSGVNCSLKL